MSGREDQFYIRIFFHLMRIGENGFEKLLHIPWHISFRINCKTLWILKELIRINKCKTEKYYNDLNFTSSHGRLAHYISILLTLQYKHEFQKNEMKYLHPNIHM